jgi:hypothetical protein
VTVIPLKQHLTCEVANGLRRLRITVGAPGQHTYHTFMRPVLFDDSVIWMGAGTCRLHRTTGELKILLTISRNCKRSFLNYGLFEPCVAALSPSPLICSARSLLLFKPTDHAPRHHRRRNFQAHHAAYLVNYTLPYLVLHLTGYIKSYNLISDSEITDS